MTVAIVCGGRKFFHRDAAFEALDAVHAFFGLTRVVEGGQRFRDENGVVKGGGDWWAFQWAAFNDVECTTVPADWKRWGNAAGPIRNRRMLVEEKPDVVFGLPGGPGTLDMLDQAERAGVLAVRIGPWPRLLLAAG